MKNRSPRICLIDVIERASATIDPPLNLISLANYLSSKGVVPKENFLILNSVYDDVITEIEKFKPDIIGFSVLTPFYDLALELAKRLSEISESWLIIGSYHISALPEQLERPFDIGVVGEGELTLVELVKLWMSGNHKNCIKLAKVKGIVFFGPKEHKVVTDKRPLMDVKKLPMVDWTLLPERRIAKFITLPINGRAETRKFTVMYTARGCPYNCAFCAHRVLTDGSNGVRYFPMKRVLDEMEYLHREYKVDCIQILDDTFAVSKDRLRLMISGLRKRGLLGKICFYTIFVRANIIDQEFSDMLKTLGVIVVFIGIESGSANVLKIIKDGPLSAEMVKKAIICFQKNQIYVSGSFMIYSPGEERSDLKKTVRLADWFANQKNAYALGISVTTPYPGTKLWREAQNTKIIKGTTWDDFRMFYLGNANKMPRIFYQPSWARAGETYDYWMWFTNRASDVRNRVKSVDNWEESEIMSKIKNDELTVLWARPRVRLEFMNRINRFRTAPMLSIKKLIAKPRIIRMIFDDIKTLVVK